MDERTPRPLASIEDVMRFTGLSKRTIYNHRARNEGIAALGKRVGRELRWRWEDIERWADEKFNRAA